MVNISHFGKAGKLSIYFNLIQTRSKVGRKYPEMDGSIVVMRFRHHWLVIVKLMAIEVQASFDRFVQGRTGLYKLVQSICKLMRWVRTRISQWAYNRVVKTDKDLIVKLDGHFGFIHTTESLICSRMIINALQVVFFVPVPGYSPGSSWPGIFSSKNVVHQINW